MNTCDKTTRVFPLSSFGSFITEIVTDIYPQVYCHIKLGLQKNKEQKNIT
jgi:hypothetical protein